MPSFVGLSLWYLNGTYHPHFIHVSTLHIFHTYPPIYHLYPLHLSTYPLYISTTFYPPYLSSYAPYISTRLIHLLPYSTYPQVINGSKQCSDSGCKSFWRMQFTSCLLKQKSFMCRLTFFARGSYLEPSRLHTWGHMLNHNINPLIMYEKR